MEITYSFGSGISYTSYNGAEKDDYITDDFVYDVDEREWIDSLSKKDIIEMTIEAWNKLSKIEQDRINKELLDDSYELLKDSNGNYTPPFSLLYDENKDYIIDDFIYNVIDNYYDEIKEYFEREAEIEYNGSSYSID